MAQYCLGCGNTISYCDYNEYEETNECIICNQNQLEGEEE